WGVTGALAAAFFALCGALRLARFNVQHVAGSFQGLPIPAGGHFLVSFVFAGLVAPAWLMALVTVGTGLLMISSVPFGNLKALKKGNLNKARAGFVWGLAVTLIVVLRELAPLAGIAIYILSGFLHVDWGKWLSLEEDEKDSVSSPH
ncbi:MAG: CDP-alcohol phosphatidyltransferase family protein, partial [Thermovirgaceae bacterium]